VRAKAQELQEDIDRFIRDMDQKKLELATKEEAEFVRANRHERGLLTAQGDDLVDAVRACLEEIGFHVVNVDQEIATKGDRREDLRISDHDRPDWVAIAEVRGYKRGAQLNDLLRISRFVARYVQEAGRMPDASWYIVNHNMDQDPSIRPTPLASNPTEVTTFVDGNGLIIDTRFLFKKLMEVRSGLIESRDLRLALISGTGVIDV
jgi:hypothetical protein